MSNLTIVLADDDADEHDFFREAVGLLGEEVTLVFFKDGKELISYLQTALFLPDIVFVDINMPMMSGLDTLKHIKAYDNTKIIPVVMYSTSAHKNDIHKAYKQGAILYFRKENSPEQLSTKLKVTIENIKAQKPFAEDMSGFVL